MKLGREAHRVCGPRERAMKCGSTTRATAAAIAYVRAMNEAAPIAATSAVPVYAPGPVPAVGGKVGVLLVNLGTPDGADCRVGAPLSQGVPLRSAGDRDDRAWSGSRSSTASSCRIRPRRKARDYADLGPGTERIPAARPSPARRPRSRRRASPRAAAVVDWAMRYGKPSIASRIDELGRRLRPHPRRPALSAICAATTATVKDEAFEALKGCAGSRRSGRRRPITTTPPISTRWRHHERRDRAEARFQA